MTPDEDLADLQAVEVSGSGLVWSDQAVLVQCAANPADIGDCDLDSRFVSTTAGSFTADYRVSALIDTGNHGPVDCRDPDACVLAVSSGYSASPAKSRRAARPRSRHRGDGGHDHDRARRRPG